MEKKMFGVSYEIFKAHVERYNLKPIQGIIFHSEDYTDEAGVVRAYRETSSWSSNVVYMIDDENYSNLETISLIGNIINS